jgi:acyl-coenzyme A synthetase/AMP-(fatty) acid ligase
LPEHKRLASVLVVTETFPRTASMKLKRDVLAEQLRSEQVAADLVTLTTAPMPTEARP